LTKLFDVHFSGVHRIAPRRRIHDGLDRVYDAWIMLQQPLAPSPRAPLPISRYNFARLLGFGFQLAATRDDCLGTDPQRLGYGADSPVSKSERFIGYPQPATPLIQKFS
jgi:hypothetical protein